MRGLDLIRRLSQKGAAKRGPFSSVPAVAAKFGKRAVGDSEDLRRIVALPRRPKPDCKKLAAEMTALLRRENSKCKCAELRPEAGCITDFNEIQGWYLSEAREHEGVLGPIGVGFGKTALGIFLAMIVAGCKVAVLLVPPSLKKQFEYDFECWSQHFKTPNLAGGSGIYTPGRPTLHVVAYSELSHESFSSYLTSIKPDLIIADEVQNLKDLDSVRTDRFVRYFRDNPETKFFCHSGSISTRSLNDYAHLSAIALGEDSPLPLHTATVAEWASAVDPVTEFGIRAPAGALKALCNEGEPVLDGFSRRLRDTPGVVATEESTLGLPPLYLEERKVKNVPREVLDAIRNTKSLSQRPDGEELLQATEVAATCRQLACGFFYRWRFPRGEPEELITQWFNVRQSWNRELRERLKYRVEGMDSPLLCRRAAERWHNGYEHEGKLYPPFFRRGPLPTWESVHLPAWEKIEDAVYHETQAVWISDFLVTDAAEWARKNVGIVWYENEAFGSAVAKASGCPMYGGGEEASAEIIKETGKRTIIASIKAHGTGKNLQRFRRNLVAQIPSDGGAWEQLIGRTHRQGQKAADVKVTVYQHTDEVRDALQKAQSYAKYIQTTLGTPQKLLYGIWY